jgi:hypothetical protein
MALNIRERCDAIEECYEFMLAYAAQGLPGATGHESGGQLRHSLTLAREALAGIADAYSTAVREAALTPAAPYEAFLAVLKRDAGDAQAAIDLALAQPVMSSQLIDNLNASIHLRALLTDLFLIDEILRPQPAPANPASAS